MGCWFLFVLAVLVAWVVGFGVGVVVCARFLSSPSGEDLLRDVVGQSGYRLERLP